MKALETDPLTRKFWMSFLVSSTLLFILWKCDDFLASKFISEPITGKMLTPDA